MRFLLACLAISSLLLGCSASAGSTARTVAVKVSEFAFSPAQVELKVGERVRLSVSNGGTLDHDMNIRDMPTSGSIDSHSGGEHAGAHESKLHVFTPRGKSGTLEFTPSVAGTYEVYCSVEGHKEAGMTAKIVVR